MSNAAHLKRSRKLRQPSGVMRIRMASLGSDRAWPLLDVVRVTSQASAETLREQVQTVVDAMSVEELRGAVCDAVLQWLAARAPRASAASFEPASALVVKPVQVEILGSRSTKRQLPVMASSAGIEPRSAWGPVGAMPIGHRPARRLVRARMKPKHAGPPDETAREQFLRSEGFSSTEQIAGRLGVTRQAVQKALDDGRMFAFDLKGCWRVPTFFGDPRYERRWLKQVTGALGELPAASKYQFFTQPRGSLDGLTPLEALGRGRLSEVLAAARAFAAS